MYISCLILFIAFARDKNRFCVVPGCMRLTPKRTASKKPRVMYVEQIDFLAICCNTAGWRLNDLNLKNDRKKQRWLFRLFLLYCEGMIMKGKLIFDSGTKAVFQYDHHGG